MRIKVIKNQENLGVAKGNNQGIAAALQDECQYILLINNDTIFESKLLEKLVNGLAQYDCDLIVPKMLYHDRPNVIWFAGGHFLRWKGYLNIQEGEGEEDKGQYDVPRQIECAPTCCMLITRRTFEQVGLMDEKYFVYYDDTDFCLRVLRSGLKMYFLPLASLIHKVSSLTGGSASNFVMRYTIRNLVYYIRKNFNGPCVICWIFGIQLVLWMKVIAGKDNIKEYVVKQRAYIEGLKM